jgi:hypothetical protein
MVPFRVFDAENKQLWIVLNYHSHTDGGHYLVAKEEDGEQDGYMDILPAEKIKQFRLVDFLDGASD